MSKGASEMAGRQRAFSREFHGRNIPLKICVHELFRAPFLPSGEATPSGREDVAHASIRLTDVSAQSEADMFREEPRDLVKPIKRGQQHLRESFHGSIHDAHAGSKF